MAEDTLTIYRVIVDFKNAKEIVYDFSSERDEALYFYEKKSREEGDKPHIKVSLLEREVPPWRILSTTKKGYP